ncbi:MAG: PAS domain S-box protein [Desulfobacula sp.]|uniref:PAS domain S-box protein n=1 Tax=Desulfobacula sp. TaxID=2593537 RepID=UPI0025C68683|nr:PAS domain S-box protein [Desulfobacula sp.]MCD4722549.1 PAS domain S-box protein [Desulfobacula sp.]
MSTISIPPVVMATLMFYVGFYHFLIYLRKKDNRQNLTFAFSCFSVGLYSICCAGLYSVSSPELGVEWQRFQVITLAVLGITFLWFIADYTGQTNKKIVMGFTVYYVFAALAGLFIRSDLTWTSVASIKEIRLPFGYDIRYDEMTPGVLTDLQGIVGLLFFIYIFMVSLKFYRSENKENGMPLLIAIILLFAGLMNDTFVSSGGYNFIYILEYSYIGMILVFTFFLTNNVIKAGEIKVALRESEERFRMLFDEAPDAIFTFTLDDRIIDANAAASKMLGYERKEFKTMTVADLQAPEIRGKVGSVLRNELIHGKFFEGLDIHKDGTIIPIEVHNHKMHIKGQDIVLSVVRDISERKQVEEELRKNEEKLKAIFEANPDPVAVYDINGYPLYLNPAFTESFGWTLNELQGKRIPFVPEDQQEITHLKIKEIYESGNSVRFETKRLSKHGKIIDTFLSAAIIKDLQGINNGLVVNLTDITEQKKIEAQLRQSQKMEAIGTLAGGIAHDFNNILSGIFGYTQLAGMNLDDPVKTKKNLDQLGKGAQRAAELVQQILTFSRQAEYKKKSLELFFIIKEAVKFLRSSIPTTIEIQEKILSRAMVLADPTQVHQVVMNLCTNAYHAMLDSGGTLFVELNDVEITPQNHSTLNSYIPGHYVKLEVRDTGHGMNKKALERIFDPYFTTKDTDKGTGLGLAVVDGIVKEHNGYIKAYSKVGHGSTFQVFWPVIEKKSSHDFSKKKKISLPKGTEQIMFVDDEIDILVTSQKILESQGYKVATFQDGISALQAFTKNPDFFDLVITDMTMPQMAGDELAVNILRIQKEIPIILCTGFSETMSEEKAASLGIKGFLLKPVLKKDFVQKICEVLNKNKN